MKNLFEVYRTRVLRSFNLLNSRREARREQKLDLPVLCQPSSIVTNIAQLSVQDGIEDSAVCSGDNCDSTPGILFGVMNEIIPGMNLPPAAGVAAGGAEQFIHGFPRDILQTVAARASVMHSSGTQTQITGSGPTAYVSCLPQEGAESLMVFVPTSDHQKTSVKNLYPARISSISKALDSLGSCQSATPFKQLVNNGEKRSELIASMSEAFAIVPEAWMILSLSKSSDSIAIQACQQLKTFMQKHVQILESSLALANAQRSSPAEIQAAMRRINGFKNEMHAAITLNQEAESQIVSNWSAMCGEIIADAVKVGCSTSNIIVSNYDEVENLRSEVPGFFRDGKTNDQVFCERLPTGQNQSIGFPDIPMLASLSNRDGGRAGGDGRGRQSRQTALEAICGRLDDPNGFNAFLRNGACRGRDDIAACVQDLESSSRMGQIHREFSEQRSRHASGHEGGASAVAAAAALEYVTGDPDIGLAEGERAQSMRSYASATQQAAGQYEAIGAIFGGLGDRSSSSQVATSNTSSMFNAATTQAFGNQARVSAATSGAVMSRFIAAVPPMQNMPQQQQRQQMDQALERSVNQTVAELENKASGTTSASERQKYLDEIAELRRLMADQTARNDLITQQMAAMNQAPAEETQAAPTKRRRAPAFVENTPPESPEVQSTGFQTGGGRTSGQAASNNAANSQDLAGAQGFGGGAAAAGRSVSSVSEARDAAPNDSSLRLVVGGAGGQVIPAAQVITISVPSGDEQALKDAILGQRERLNVGEDGYAVVEVIDPASGRASLVRVKIENDNVIVQNFTAEQLRQTKIVSDTDPKPRQIRYSLQAMTNLLNQAAGGSN